MQSGQLAGACLLDTSAAFDMVDHDLLVQKLALFGFDSDSVAWARSYLELRSQSVMIEGCLSKLFKVNSEGPQGSILGPLFFTLFSNELPEVIHDTAINQLDPEPDVKQGWPAYAMHIKLRGEFKRMSATMLMTPHLACLTLILSDSEPS